MLSRSLNTLFTTTLLLTTVYGFSSEDYGTCNPESPWTPDILRVELNTNVWSANTSLTPLRGMFLWVGGQYWRMDANTRPSPFPILTTFSTAHNHSYISTSSSGSKQAPCPNSATFNYNRTNDDVDTGDDDFFGGCCTFNSSFTCNGFYDLSKSAPIYFETASNFTGSPESFSTTAVLDATSVRYGVTDLELVLPWSTYEGGYSSIDGGPGVSNSFYSTRNNLFGFVDKHEDQVLGLGINSTFINYLYDSGRISSRSLGLYYGVPEVAGYNKSTNGTIVFGGYATERMLGNFSTETYPVGQWTLARSCPWEVQVASIASGGTNSTEKYTTCVEPSELGLVLPQSVYDTLSFAEGSDVTITLTNGLIVTIPSSLVSIRSVTDQDQSPILGVPFLSQVYLFVDYQMKTLSISRANNEFKFFDKQHIDNLECIEHKRSVGDLGWAVKSPATSPTPTGAQTSSSTTKTSPAVNVQAVSWTRLFIFTGLYALSFLT